MIYKFLFMGSMGAGKSTAIQCISDIEVINTDVTNTDLDKFDKPTTTVGFDYGEIVIDDPNDPLRIQLYGTPGQERFSFMWEHLLEGCLGVFLFADASSADGLSEFNHFCDTIISNYDGAIVAAITHVDSTDNLNIEAFQSCLAAIDSNIPIFTIDARSKDDVLLLVEVMLSSIEYREYNKLEELS